MRIQRSISSTKEPAAGTAWAERRLWLRDRAARLRRAWRRSLRDRSGWAKVCWALGAMLALAALGGMGYRAQVHRALNVRAIARSVQRGLDRAARSPLLKPPPRNTLPSLYLDFEPLAEHVLATQQQKARRAGILLPRDVVSVEAQIHLERNSSNLQRVLEGRAAPRRAVRVSLAGSRCDGLHPIDQWQPNKWSLEVQTQPGASSNDASFLDLDAFTLRSPALRGYLEGWLYREALHNAGLPATRITFVNLVLNGENWGVYALESRLEPEGPAWFESLDAQARGRLLAHADLWEKEIPGSCRNGAQSRALARRLLAEDAPAQAAYTSEVARITRREYVDELRIVYRRAFDRYRRALAGEFFSAYLAAPWEVLPERQARLSARAAGADWVEEEAPSLEQGVWPALASPETMVPSIPVPALLPSVEDVLARHPFLTRSDRPGFLGVIPGDWQVTGDLVLPQGVGLWAAESFTLRFGRGASLVARAPLILRGPDGDGIRLLPRDDHWAGVRVLRADPETSSVWSNVEIRGARGVQAEAGALAGRAGILFYESPIVLERCRVLDSYAPQAFSVLRAPFEVRESEFGAASGDLVRLRAAQGTISRSAFHDALGAAIHLEQSALEVVDVGVQRVQGEALWAGEQSRVRVQGLRADRVGVGVMGAGAQARVRDVRLGRVSTAGFLAVAGASLDLASVTYEDDSVQIRVQEGSEAVLDGVPVEARALVLEELRPTRAPPPPMTPLGVRFGPSIWLVGYELTTPERAPGETIEVILYWRAFAYLEQQYTIFMHVRNAAGETVAGWDMMPRYNTFPTTDWPLVERIDDVHIVPLPQELPPGEYTVALGLYDWATGVRLPAFSKSGEPLFENTLVLEERVTVNEPVGPDRG